MSLFSATGNVLSFPKYFHIYSSMFLCQSHHLKSIMAIYRSDGNLNFFGVVSLKLFLEELVLLRKKVRGKISKPQSLNTVHFHVDSGYGIVDSPFKLWSLTIMQGKLVKLWV